MINIILFEALAICIVWATFSRQEHVFLIEVLVTNAMFIGRGFSHFTPGMLMSNPRRAHPIFPFCGRPRISLVEQCQQNPNDNQDPYPICYCIMEFGPVLAVQGHRHRHISFLLIPEFCNRNGSLDLSELLWLGCHRPNASATKTPLSLMTAGCIVEALFCSSVLSAIYALNILLQLANHLVSGCKVKHGETSVKSHDIIPAES